MKRKFSSFLFIGFLIPCIIAAEPDKKKDASKSSFKNFEFGGYIDFSAADYFTNSGIFSFGNIQMALKHNYENFITMAASMLFNQNTYEIDEAYVNFHVFKHPIAKGNHEKLKDKGINVLFGKFDLSYGSDCRHYIAGERITATAPLTTKLLLDNGLNDIGMKVSLDIPFFSLDAMALRGTGDGSRFVLRAGFLPFDSEEQLKKNPDSILDIGFSYYFDTDSVWQREDESGFAVDVTLIFDSVKIGAEFYMQNLPLESMSRDGFNAGIMWDIKKIFKQVPLILFARFDAVRERDNNGLLIASHNGIFTTRISAGINYNIKDIVIIKGEYLHVFSRDESIDLFTDSSSEPFVYNNDSFIIQVVIKF